MKAQFMSIAVLVIFILMLSEVILLISLQISYDKLQQSSSLTSTSNNYASLISKSANGFGKASLSAALNTLFKYEYNSTMRKGNFISSFNTYMVSLVTNGTVPNVVAGSGTANTIKGYMGNATFLAYNANLARSLGIASGNINVTETKPIITQLSPYTLSMTYTETVSINNSGTYLTYPVTVNASISLNGTPDLYYAQQGVLRYIRFSNMSNLSSVIGNAYATNGSYSFAYGTLYKVAAGASSCPTASNSLILFTVNAVNLHGCENNFGGLITYGGTNTITEAPTVPYLFYPPSSNALNSFKNGQSVLLYGPSLSTLNIENLRSNISNGYYFASPYAPSYPDRVNGVFTNQSSNGMFNFMGYNRQAAYFNGASSNVTIPHSTGLDSSSQYTVTSWIKTANTIGIIFSGWSGGSSGYQLFMGTSSGGNICVWAGGSNTYCSNTFVADGSWHYVVGVFQSSYRALYVDGRLVGSSALANNLGNSGNNQIGEQCSTSCNLFYKGLIANVQVYNSSLNSSQIQGLYQQGIEGLPMPNAGLAGWWSLNGNANDYSGSGVSGTPTNVIYTGIPSYNRDSALVKTVPSGMSAIPGVGQCTSTKACLAYNTSGLYLSNNPLLFGNGKQTAAGFNGRNSYIIVPSSSSLTQSKFTISAWAKNNGTAWNGWPTVVSKRGSGSNYILLQETNGANRMCLYVPGSSCLIYNTPAGFDITAWHNYVGTFDGSTMSIYVDGALANSIAYSSSTASLGDLYIGSDFNCNFYGNGCGTNPITFNGLISNVQMYGNALTTNQIALLYNRGVFGPALTNNTLDGWWPLNGNANDYSGNGNNGTAYQVGWPLLSSAVNGSGIPTPAYTGGLVGPASGWQSLGLGNSYSPRQVYCIGDSPTNSIAYSTLLSNVGVGPWNNGTKYPISTYAEGCGIYNGYIYCMGGQTTGGVNTQAVYYAPISSTGIGAWTSSTSYPYTYTYRSQCVTYNGYIYCVGGFSGGSQTNLVYYAPVSSTGVGAWAAASNNYPITIWSHTCVTANGYIYCVGGTSGSDTSAIYYAPLSSTGVGSWGSASYPAAVEDPGCVTFSDYIYCVGGYLGGAYSGATYYAPISSTGIGAWTASAAYPLSGYTWPCVTNDRYIYCIGGYSSGSVSSVYYAPLSSTGIGPWNATKNYPIVINSQYCGNT
ncbi:MAG: hypothetical protein KGI00_04480 [Candidatus Micrarchaeota archaeon]|nr:hypothetical protein [Candidatus Micrarchaeota archaeon]